ncbi:MAG: Dephospho-CoA kinase (EC [uncultured Thiotrichaceae bacterium]|uniref:Dephospho-CoA kinase n=1 Tax=uncultured Thiotrichaceae bacterium TaxID=298394 RepID=A0A6S6SV09_9GAMM|nr:MAG: Dephospho-CoA kinase (EC [uncultured Thiotrichaceae bacterium]
MALNVGLTGGIASGKSTVTRLFETYGVPIVDADIIAKDLVQPGRVAYQGILASFGEDIVLPNGELDRKKLKGIIFNDPSAKTRLEEIIHPAVNLEIRHQIQKLADEAYIIVDVPLLIEKNYQSYFDEILVVDCPYEQQLARVMLRDDISKAVAEKIINAQVSRDERLKFATYVIHNAGVLEALEKQVKALHNNFKDNRHEQ